jgi:hypothetical protein
LTVYFFGQSFNAAGNTEEPYIGINDGSAYAESRYTDTGNTISDIQEEEWHKWSIALAEFNYIDLTEVQSLHIGFGIRNSANSTGGYGVVYFDDIRLETSPENIGHDNSNNLWIIKSLVDHWLTNEYAVDLNGDSIVNLKDFAILTNSVSQ